MAKGIVALFLAAGLAGPALGQTAEPATDVAPLTVVAGRRPPVEMLPDFDTCQQAASDPFTAALIGADAAPRMYVKTRIPRNPDYSAPPRTPPGSPLPEVMSMKDYQRAAQRVRRADDNGQAYRDAASPGGVFEGVDTARMQAIARCLDDALEPTDDGFGMNGSFSSLGPMGTNGRLEILLPDWRLPSVNLHIVYTSRRGLIPAVRAFIDVAAERLAEQCLKKPGTDLFSEAPPVRAEK